MEVAGWLQLQCGWRGIEGEMEEWRREVGSGGGNGLSVHERDFPWNKTPTNIIVMVLG